MRKTGNIASNKVFNPHNTKPKVPLDADEVDSAIERFIRQKYEQKSYAEGAAPVRAATVQSYTGNSREVDEQPPPPPPKPSKRFGFGLRSVSSVLPSSGNRNKDNTRKSSAQGKTFGATIGVTDDGLQWKLITLREMGFPDEQRNSSVLKGLNGDLERAIESLVRLGEGVPGAVRSPTSSHFSSGKNTPSATESRSQGSTIGASVQKLSRPNPPQMPAASSQIQLAGQTLSSPSSSRSYNPFENIQPIAAPQQPQQQRSLDNAMQNLSLGLQQPPPQQQHVQALFPNTTGGYPNNQDQMQHMRLQQSMTPPPVPQIPQPFFNNPYAQQQQSYNPFFDNVQQPPPPPQQQRQQQAAPQTAYNPFVKQQPQFGSANPFFDQNSNNINAVFSQPTQVQQQQQPAQQNFQQPLQQPHLQWMNQPIQNSPTQFTHPQSFAATQQQQIQPQGQAQSQSHGSMPMPGNYEQQMQRLQAQQTGRVDKSSILALYNYPQLAPQQPQPQSPSGQQEVGEKSAAVASPPAQTARLPAGVTPGQRSATMPVSRSKNPFARPGIPDMTPPTENGHIGAQESMDSGRHSPDAFASLSARFVR